MNPDRPWKIVHSEASMGWGGQEHRVLAEMRGFKVRGAEVRLIADPGSHLHRRSVAEGIPAFAFSPLRRLHVREFVRVRRWLREFQPDVVNTHSSRDGWVVGLAARAAKVPFLIRSRHIDVPLSNRTISRFVYARLADHILTTSDRITAGLQRELGLSPRHITTLPTGIDLSVFHPDGPAAELVPPGGSGPLIGMVSVLRSWKGHRTFLEAIVQLRRNGFQGRFVIVGEGPIRRSIEEWMAELGLRDIVTLAGHREDVPAVLRALDLLVVPSLKYEGVPQIGLQALASKTPIVGSDAGGIPEIVQTGRTGRLFPAGQAPALAEAIQEVFRAPETTGRFVQEGRKLVETKHGLDAMIDQLDALYRAHTAEEARA